MPVTLTLAAAPRRRRMRAPWTTTDPKSRRLKRLALGLVPTLTTLWGTLLRDLRADVSREDLDDALAVAHDLDAEQVLTDAWQTHVDQEARRVFPVLFADLWQDVGDALKPERQAVSGGALFPLMDTATEQHEHQAYLGGQLFDLWLTTLLSFRQATRRSRQTAGTATAQAAMVAQTVGLTPRQSRSIDAAAQEWQDEGLSAATSQQRTQDATSQALALRVRGIAETQAFGMVNLTQRLVMQQTAEAAGATVLRFWTITDDDRLCDRCAAVPGLNPDGVGMQQPFQTPEGPVMDPPLHSLCRCDVDYNM